MSFFRGIWKTSSLLVAAVAVTLALAAPVAAAPQIVVSGDRADAETIKSYFTGTSDADIDKGLEALRASGRYSSVSASRQGGSIVIRVAEGNTINRVALEGNSKIKTDQLLPELRTKARAAFSPAMAESDVARITEIYRRSGRAAAKVSYRTVPLGNGRIDVVFTVEEGSKTGVKEIKFVGNNVYSTRRLVGMMETTEMNFMSFFKSSDVYDPDRIASDLEIIRRFYLKNGYADFRVVSSDAKFDAAPQGTTLEGGGLLSGSQGGYVITIAIEEGPQYHVSTADIESHIPDIPSDALNDELRLKTGDVYNGDAVEKTVEALTRAAAKKGYAFRRRRPWRSTSCSMKDRAFTSNASSFAATRAHAITSFVVSSISARATPTTACSSIAPNAASMALASSRK